MSNSAHPYRRLVLHAGWLSGLCFLVAMLSLGGDHEGFRAATQPLGHLGARQADAASWWNCFGFILPGLLGFAFVLALETCLRGDGGGRLARIGTGMLMLSALAFAAQGVLPFDLDDPHAPASQHHVTALALALLGMVAGAVCVSASLWRRPAWHWLAWPGTLLAALLLLFLLWPPQDAIAWLHGRPGHAQRLVFLLQFAWFALAAAVALAQTQPVR